MPLRNLPGGGASYALLAFDEAGAERRDDPDGADGRLSQRILDQLSADAAVTDVFLFAHGWNGDIADAIDQYDRWIGAMEAQAADKAAMLKRRPISSPTASACIGPAKPGATRRSARRRPSPALSISWRITPIGSEIAKA